MTLDDQATAHEELERELSIRQARAKNQPLKFTGRCLFCDDTIETGRFCFGGDCKEDWEFEQKMKGIMGR